MRKARSIKQTDTPPRWLSGRSVDNRKIRVTLGLFLIGHLHDVPAPRPWLGCRYFHHGGDVARRRFSVHDLVVL
jgi:hypothetical protein